MYGLAAAFTHGYPVDELPSLTQPGGTMPSCFAMATGKRSNIPFPAHVSNCKIVIIFARTLPSSG